ncbi:MAG TPA: 2-dehydropantoate 2-reductase [Candidatus Bathyarchaeia archaeon]|nr:2-dehydropantoate 2-reductase [Candidatus Bathyarchaeia archaeon]
MHFGIVGAGAIGCLFGASLSLAGHDVTLIHRDLSIVRAIQKNGVSLRETDTTVTGIRVPVRKGPATLPGAEVLIIAVKAYDTKAMAASYRGLVPLETTVLSLQNGLGNIETLQSALKNEVLAGSTTEGAFSLGPGSVLHTGRGLTVIGDPRGTKSDTCSRIKIAFEEAGFRTKISSNMAGVLWTKAIVNSAINPLSGLTRLPNGALAKSSELRKIGFQVMREGMSVSHAERVTLAGDPRKLWRRILLSTKANKSSMLQDIERGKMTEIRQLNGAILSRGNARGVETPTNRILTRIVLGIEESSKP